MKQGFFILIFMLPLMLPLSATAHLASLTRGEVLKLLADRLKKGKRCVAYKVDKKPPSNFRKYYYSDRRVLVKEEKKRRCYVKDQ